MEVLAFLEFGLVTLIMVGFHAGQGDPDPDPRSVKVNIKVNIKIGGGSGESEQSGNENALPSSSGYLPDYSNFADEQTESRVVGGTVVDIRDYPYQVVLKRTADGPSGHPWCGGSIYSPKIILTAAHCLMGADRKPVPKKGYYEVWAGVTDFKNIPADKQVRKVIDHRQHENFGNYKAVADGDIGIVFLDKPLVYNEKVQPIKISTEPDPSTAYITGVGTGYGYTKQLEMSSPRNPNPKIRKVPEGETWKLQMVGLPIMSDQDCTKKVGYPIDDKQHQGTFCVGTGKKTDVCKGDSGGPLACWTKDNKIELCGIVSHGLAGCALGTPTIFTKVSYFKDWIEKYAGKQEVGVGTRNRNQRSSFRG